MALDEVLITRAIIERYTEKLLDNLDIDVAVVGGGAIRVDPGLAAGPARIRRWRFLNGNCPSAAACGAAA